MSFPAEEPYPRISGYFEKSLFFFLSFMDVETPLESNGGQSDLLVGLHLLLKAS